MEKLESTLLKMIINIIEAEILLIAVTFKKMYDFMTHSFFQNVNSSVKRTFFYYIRATY